MADTFTTLWNRLLLRAPGVGAALAQDLVKDSYNQLAERRQWTWLVKSGAFFPPSFTSSGTVSTSPGSYTYTGVGTVFDQSMVGGQIRIGAPAGSSYPTYTIMQVLSGTVLIVDKPWVGPAITASAYTIFQCYFPVPADFNYFYSLVNTTNSYRLWTNVTQAQLDIADPQRVNIGQTFCAAFYDDSPNYNGIVGSVLQVVGAGPDPVSTANPTTGYTFPADSTYVVEITTGGAVGVAVFKWKQGTGSYTTGVAVADSNPITLSNGVRIAFPAAVYVLGDVFIVNCFAQTIPSVPRYEFWPRPILTPYVYPYLYIARHDTLSDATPQLPRFIADRGDVILEMALGACAKFPGTSAEQQNPYYNLGLAKTHDAKAEYLINQIEVQDDNVAMKDLIYNGWGWAPCPWIDGSYLQSHAWPWAGPGG